MTRSRTVFLDRDGTLNVKAASDGYITRPDDLQLLPGVVEAVRRLNDSGRTVVVVSNQRGVARGVMSVADVEAVNERLDQLLRAGGAHLDAHYFCPHEEKTCDCRKPAPGLLLRAASDHAEVNLADAVLVGDAESDVSAAAAVCVPAVRIAPVGTPSGADVLCSDLWSAVDWILTGSTSGRSPK